MGRHMEIDHRYKQRCRDVEVKKRQDVWEKEENARLIQMNRDASQLVEERKEARASAKEKLCERSRQLRQDDKAQSQATVHGFTEKTVSTGSVLCSILTQRPIEAQ